MAYRNGYARRGGYRPQTAGRVARPNARPGNCRSCGEEIPAGAGQLWREESGAWSVVHVISQWTGSPVSGQYSGGCPAETDRMNREGKFGGPDGARPERDNITFAGQVWAATTRPAPVSTRRSATAWDRRGKCEDAPCCGCCD